MWRVPIRLPIVVAFAIGLLALSLVSEAQAQTADPTVTTVAVTSDPGDDGGYAIDDDIEVGLTFSQAVTVTGTPQITLNVGGQNRTAAYSEGSGNAQLVFSYTVAAGDEDTDGFAVVANSLALNDGTIRAGATNAALTHAALQANDHKVDGVAPTVTVGGETRTYVPPDRQFNVVFYFSEKVYGLTDSEITVTNGTSHDVRAPYGNATWPRYTRWDVIIVSAAEGPVTVTLQAGAATDAYGNENTAPGSALSVIAADPVMVEVTRTTSGFEEGGKAEFTVTRSRDNGAIPVSLSLDQTGDFLSGAVEVYPPPDPNMPENPITPTEVEFTETPFTLNVTFAAGETSKRISVLTEDDNKDEDDGTVTLSVPAKAGQYKYIPGNRASVTADVRDNDVPATVSLYWSRPFHPYDTYQLNTVREGSSITLGVYGRPTGQPLLVTLSVTEVGSYLDLDGERALGYESLGNGRLRVTVPVGRVLQNINIPLLENDVMEADGSVTITMVPDPERSYIPRTGFSELTIPVRDNDSPSTVSISAPDSITEGEALSYTLTRTWDPAQSQGELSVNVELAQTGDYITWPAGRQPDADDQVTISVTFAARALTATLALETVDDEVSEDNGSVTATVLADDGGSYVTDADSDHTTRLLDNDPPIISVSAVSAEVTEGTVAQFRVTRSGNTSGPLRVGLYVSGLPKIMTDATETIVLTSDNEDQSQRLTINGAWVDYILEFAAGDTEKTFSLTTEADSVNEGDGWLAVSILQRTGVSYTVETGRAQVHVKDDDIPTVSLTQPVGPTGLTLSSDGTTWEGKIVEGTQFTYSSTCTGVTEFSDDARVNLEPVSMWVQYSNHPAFYGEQHQNETLGYNRAGIHGLGADCSSRTVTYRDYRFYVGPENGVVEIEIVPRSELVNAGSGRYRPRFFTELLRQYEAAAAEAQAAGTLITKKNIFHPVRLGGYHPRFACNESDLRYCPQYEVGTVKKIRLAVTNRDPTILIKAESTSVTEGQPARFILEREWATDLLALAPPESLTVLYLRASQDGQYITGALPTTITFGQNETRKVIELQTVDDSAFGDNGSVTIELLPDTSTASVNLHGKYTTWQNWVGHTPAGGRSDRATVTITNNDDKPGITIAPASAQEGDSGSSSMTFTLTLAQAVTEAVTVNYVTSDGTATAGQDYTAVTSGEATIPANSTSATFTVSVTGDTTDEANETFNVTISLPEPEPDLNGSGNGEHPVAITGGATATAAGTIMDDDPVVVTVAPKAASVVEGQDAVFVLTRTGNTEEALSMFVRLRAPGRVATLRAEFDAAATTAELTVATADNDLVDYPPTHDYTIEVIGDGDINGGDDAFYTPGDPDEATVTATDDDELQIITVHAQEASVGEGNSHAFVFRRTGDTSKRLRIWFKLESRHGQENDGGEDYFSVTSVFEPGQTELIRQVPYDPDDGNDVIDRLFPYKWTAQLFGDGHIYGVHRVWRAGTPDTATIIYYDDDRTKQILLRAVYPNRSQIGQTINVDFSVLNAGTEATGNTITVSSVKRHSRDMNETKPAEPRVGCTITGPIAAGVEGTCRATFTPTAQDLTDSPLSIDSTASDGTTTSSPFRIYLRVLDGVTVGFEETTRLVVTEPANGAANAKAVLEVTRVGEPGEQVQVAYTVEPIRTPSRPYPPEAGADYADNSATPGILTFEANQTKKNITIDILGDEIDEPTELLRVTLVPPRGVLVESAKRDRVVAIVDGDPPSGESYLPTASLELVSADPTPESAGSVDFAVVLDRVWGEDARFEVELDAHNNLTATPAFPRLRQTGDFEAPDGLIHATIPAGQTRFEFSLALYDDDVREEDETFQMLLSSSITNSFRQIGDEDKVLVTIADDDFIEPTGVDLALTRNNGVFDSVAEYYSRRDVTVTASFSDIRWPTDAADAALRPADPRDVDTTVRVTFDDPNSAASLADIQLFHVADSQGTFKDVESFDIVIPAGQTSGTTTLRFKPVDDDVDEEDETVTLQGTEVVAADSDEFLPVSSASFTITDDDTRGITPSPANLADGAGIGMFESGTSTYSLVLDSEPTDTVTVTVAGRQGDLISLTPETLTFTPSDWSTAQTISIVSLDDGTDTSFTDGVISHQVSGGDYGSVTVRDIWVQIENTTQAYIYLDDAQASESDGHLEFTVSVRPILRTVPVVVRYATVDGTAVAGTDYTREVTTGQTYKIFSIPANRDTGAIRIPITDNQVYGPAKKTFTLQLTNHNNKANLEGDATSLTATGSILDDDPKPVVSVAGPAGDLTYVSEDMKGPVTFTLTLMGQSAADVTVDYATGQAQVLSGLAARQGITSATAGEDYTAATGSVTFSPGDTTKDVTVQLTDDDVSEDTEFFGFKISNVQNAQLRNRATEEVVDMGLLDDDPRGVTIDPTSISLDEPATGETAVASSYTVKLNSKPTDTVTVTVGGTNPAVSLSGTTLSNTNTLTFTASNWDTAQTVTVTPVKDANGTGETITLTHMQSGGDYNGIAADSVTVNVTDSDTRDVVLSPTSLTLTEGDDTGDSYTVELSTQPSGAVTVTIGGHSGTDLSVSGTALSATNTLTFTASNWDMAQTVKVKAGEDANADDELETLTHTASGGDYANITKDLPATVTDDAPDTVTVSFGSAAYTVAESDDSDTPDVTENTVEVTVTLSADPERTVTIPIETTNEGGASDSDYTGVPQNVTFEAGDTSKSFTFTAAHDTVDDDGESVKLSFGAALPDGVSAGTPATSAVTITDDDVPSVTVSFGSAAYTVAESDDSDTPDATENTVEVTVTLSADPERTVVIPIEAANQGGATSDDYSAPSSVTFNATETSKSFTFMATEDSINDDGESVLLAFGALPGGVSAGTPNQATVSITDDDVPAVTVSFGQSAYTVAEGGTQSVTATLSADPERTVVIPIEAANEGGATTADYSGVPQNVTFEAGDTSKSFTFTAAHDTVDDDGESVKLSFGATLPDGVSAGTPATSAVTITDDDVPSVTVSFGAASYTVAEGSSQTITVSLDEDPERTVVIPIETANEGGASGSDYSGVPENVTFEAGDTSQTFDVSATEDTLAESGEKVKLSFGTLPTDATAGTPGETTVSIADRIQGQNLPTPPTVHFENATYTVTEGLSVAIKVILSKAPGSEVVIPISRANRAGATDDDYSGTPDTLTFGATDTEKTITFGATDDMVDDDGEKVELSFGTLPGGITATSGEAAEATVTITDNDDATSKAIVLSPASITVVEEDATGTSYTVKLASQPSGAVTVTLSGLSGTDLILSGTTLNADDEHTLSFTDSNWDTAQTVTVKSNHDADPFGDTAFLLHRATGGGYDSASRILPVTVTDDDTAAVVLTPDSITVNEGDTAGVNYTVKLSHAPSGTVTVTLSGHGGTALSISGTTLNASDELTFTASNWSAAQTVTVKADNDDNAVSESLTLTHTPSGGGYSTAADLPVTVTDDDTAGIVLSETALSVIEGDDVGVSYTVKLATQPTGTVTVTVGGHSGTGLSVSGTTLTSNQLSFTTSNWNTAQTVTVKAEEGGNAIAESETLSHSASGADYANVTRDLPVTVEDGAPETVDDNTGDLRLVDGTMTDADGSPCEGRLEIYYDGEWGTICNDYWTEGNADVACRALGFVGGSVEDWIRFRSSFFPSGDRGQPILLDDTICGGDESNLLECRSLQSEVGRHNCRHAEDVGIRCIRNAEGPYVTGMEISGPPGGNGQYDVGEMVTVTVTWSEAVNVVVTPPASPSTIIYPPHLRLRYGDLSAPTTKAVYSGGSGAASTVFTATVEDRGDAPYSRIDVYHESMTTEIFDATAGQDPVGSSITSVATGKPAILGHGPFRGPESGQQIEAATIFGAPAFNDPGSDGVFGPGETVEVTFTFSQPVQVDTTGGIPSLEVLLSGTAARQAAYLRGSGAGQLVFGYTLVDGDREHSSLLVDPNSLALNGGTIRDVANNLDADIGHQGGGAVFVRPVDATAPQLRSAAVDGSSLTLTFDEELDNSVTPSSGLFAVNVNGASRSVMGVAVGQSNVILLLNPAVVAGDAVTVDYTAPADESAARLQDQAGNAAASFSGQAATNETAAEAPLVPNDLQVDRHESSKLRAAWDAPDSGPAPTGYTVQWKESEDDWLDTEEVSAKNVTETHLVIQGLTDGVEYAVRVIAYRDDADSDPSGEVTATPQETVSPAPSSATVDGATLTITFNEALDTGGVPDKSAFTVTVSGSSRGIDTVAVSSSGVTLTLVTAVFSGDSVTVDYTAPAGEQSDRLRDQVGNAAASFSGQSVTNNTAPAEVEAPGPPRNLEVVPHESGKLSASWDAPDSGPSPTGYTLQWKESADDWANQDDVSEAEVTGASHIITGLTDGTEYAIRVISTTDNAESAPSGEVLATPQETVPPAPSAASVDGATLTVTFDEALDTGGVPDKSAFAVTVAGSGRGVDTISVSGSDVTITLVTAVFSGDSVTVDYTSPADASISRLQDEVGNAAASFSGQSATNDTQAADPLTASAHGVPAAHDGSTTFIFELRFSETPRKRFSYKIMRDLAFTVTGGEVIKARRLEKGKNVRWEIHVTPDGNGPATIVLPVTTDCTVESAICTNDRRPLSNRVEIAVPGPDG